MTRLLQIVLLMAVSVPSWAETLTVVIENIETAEGYIMLRVMHGKGEFKGEREALTSIKQRAIKGPMTFSVSNLPAGEYAIQVMHDENDNGKLDSNFIGIPSEPWAFSNNATGSMGPPAWDDMKFQLSGSITQSIQLNH
tara:strand:- start:7149 stop:7565 length:417 start_codon:yes stop_codon:yes gene_type:complete